MQRSIQPLSITSVRDLLPGDILFNTEDSIDSITRGASHVMMIVDTNGGDGESSANVAHAICDANLLVEEEKNECRIQNQRLAKTSLPEDTYTVCRLKDADLAKRAASILNIWTTYLIPFDGKRRDVAEKQESNISYSLATSPDKYKLASLEKLQQQFKWEGLFRAIKFAARSDTTPIIPMGIFGEHKSDAALQAEYNHGMFCSYLIVAAIQAAALVRENNPLVRPIVGKTVRNVSNKHGDLAMLDSFFENLPIQYHNVKRAFVAQSRSEGSQHPTHAPSLLAWNFDAAHPFEVNYHELFYGLDIDAKHVMPETLLYAIAKFELDKVSENDQAWQICNVFKYQRPKPDERQKQQYQMDRFSLFSQALRNSSVEAQWLLQLPKYPSQTQPHHQWDFPYLAPETRVRERVGNVMIRELSLEQYYDAVKSSEMKVPEPNHLRFNVVTLDADGILALSDLFKSKKAGFGKEIHLSVKNIDSQSIGDLFSALGQTRFNHLVIYHKTNKIERPIIRIENDAIVEINLSGIALTSHIIDGILSLLKKKQLADNGLGPILNFCSTQMNDEMCKQLLQGLVNLSMTCQTLNLSDNGITNTTLLLLARYIKLNAKTKKPFPALSLENTDLSEMGKQRLIEFNTSLKNTIMRLDFCGGKQPAAKNRCYRVCNFFKKLVLADNVSPLVLMDEAVVQTRKENNPNIRRRA